MGGKGSGSHGKQGRKKKWQEETGTIAFRWPASFINEIKEIEGINEKAYNILKDGIQKQPGAMPEDGKNK